MESFHPSTPFRDIGLHDIFVIRTWAQRVSFKIYLFSWFHLPYFNLVSLVDLEIEILWDACYLGLSLITKKFKV